MRFIGYWVVALFCCSTICLALILGFMKVWNYAVVAALSVAQPIDYWEAFWLVILLTCFLSNRYKKQDTPK